MKNVIRELRALVAEYSIKFNAIHDSEFSNKPLPHKWSKKEVVGHLIDWAQNNLRRFIVAQYEPQPPKIVYDQDFRVKANGYQQMKKEDVIALWKLVNDVSAMYQELCLKVITQRKVILARQRYNCIHFNG